MILQNVELHNVAETQELWNGSHKPQRVPEEVRVCLNDGAQGRCLATANSEIRFVSDSGKAKVSLACGSASHFYVAHGTFLNPIAFPFSGSKITYEIEIPEFLRNLKPEFAKDLAFNPNVFRILLPRTEVMFWGVEGENIRPPKPEEVPSLRYLAYGTSITEGGCSTAPHLSYVAHTARNLGADLINLGMSGSCHCEKEFADYIASRKDWDIASLALSVNMMGGFTVEEFKERVDYLVNTVAGSDTSRPVACITLYPYRAGYCTCHVNDEEKAEAFRQVLRDVVTNCKHPNVHLIEGPEILDQVDGLGADMIHPSDYGMIRMGDNLAARLKALL